MMNATPPSPAVFLDRDKTLIEDPGYISDPNQVRLLAGAAEAVARLHQAGLRIVVVTNQSGIARGLVTEGQLAAVHERMRELMRARGSGVDAIYYCPYLDGPEAVLEAYRRDSDLRKPRPGMLTLAAEEMNLDLGSSWMIGDSSRDIQAGRAAGCRTVLIGDREEAALSSADHVAADLPTAVEYVLNRMGAKMKSQTTTPDVPTSNGTSHDCDAGSCGTGVSPVSGSAGGTSVSPVSLPRPGSPATGGLGVGSNSVSPPAGSLPPEDASSGEGTDAIQTAEREGSSSVLGEILEEMRMIRRQRQHEDFSIGKLAGAVAQAFALCAIGWAFYCWIDAATNQAAASTTTITLLFGIAFQLMALTFFATAHKK